jgi:hypothetical protein
LENTKYLAFAAVRFSHAVIVDDMVGHMAHMGEKRNAKLGLGGEI